MLNKVLLIGRLTKNPELKTTNTGVSVATFTLAVEKNYTDKNTGERGSDFIRCVVWRKQADNLSNLVFKGSLLGVEGEISTRSYDDQNGQRNYITEVIVDRFYLLEPKATADARRNGYNGNQQGYSNNQNQQGYFDSQQSAYSNQQRGYTNNQQGNYNNQGANNNNQGTFNNNQGANNNNQGAFSNNQQGGYNNTAGYTNNKQTVNTPYEDPFANNSTDTIDISDDDLPF